MGQQYFLVESIQQVGADQVIKGQFIVDGEIVVGGGQTSALASEQPKPKSKPKIKPLKPRERGGSDCLNRFLAFYKWFSALVTPLPLGALAG